MEAALARKPVEPVLLDVSGAASYTDHLLILGGRSQRQVEAIAEAVQQGMKQRGHDPLGIEWERGSHWILLDYGDVVVHVFHEDVRGYYDLEGLWLDAPRIPIAEAFPAAASA